MKAFAQIQIEQAAWSRRNFPGAFPHQALLGIVEELGEFESAETVDDQVDAIGDILIYACDYASRNNLQFREPSPDNWRRCALAIHQLSHFHLKQEQGIRYSFADAQDKKQEWFDNLLCHVFWTADRLGIDAAKTVAEVLEKVSQRDWTKNKIQG